MAGKDPNLHLNTKTGRWYRFDPSTGTSAYVPDDESGNARRSIQRSPRLQQALPATEIDTRSLETALQQTSLGGWSRPRHLNVLSPSPVDQILKSVAHANYTTSQPQPRAPESAVPTTLVNYESPGNEPHTGQQYRGRVYDSGDRRRPLDSSESRGLWILHP